MLGFAKLLPQIVPVKRETLQVVSLAMTGLMRGWGRVFHIVENKGRLRFVELGQEILFWDRMSRQGLGLPWSIKDVSVVPPGRILMACPTQRLKRWATFVGPSGTLSHTVQEHPVLLFLDPWPGPSAPGPLAPIGTGAALTSAHMRPIREVETRPSRLACGSLRPRLRVDSSDRTRSCRTKCWQSGAGVSTLWLAAVFLGSFTSSI